jgi:hypothetical protein
MDEKQARNLLKHNKINAMRSFTMMMKESRFQEFLGSLVAYRSKEGSEKFNEKLIEMHSIISQSREGNGSDSPLPKPSQDTKTAQELLDEVE